jgi:hypothetical protein
LHTTAADAVCAVAITAPAATSALKAKVFSFITNSVRRLMLPFAQ